MNEEKSTGSPVRKWAPVIVVVLLAAVVGLYWFAVLLPGPNAATVPENSADGSFGKGDDTSPDGTSCDHIYNLEEASRNNFAPPTVVDVNEANGNLLVRGPEPLIVRDGTNNNQGCKNKADWQFAYDNLGSMIVAEKGITPSYFTPGKTAALSAQMQNFNLADYAIIDVNLLNQGTNRDFFDVEAAAFGQKYSRCSGSLVDTTVRGQPGNLIWSSVGACSDWKSCEISIKRDDGDVCSFNNLTSMVSSLMAEKDPSGKKRLIYIHCSHGADRTGVTVMAYLMNAYGMNYDTAKKYTDNLGQDNPSSTNPPTKAHPVKDNYITLIQQYCQEKGLCKSGAAAAETPASVPVVTTAVPTTTMPVKTAVPTQTPVTRYNPASSGSGTI